MKLKTMVLILTACVSLLVIRELTASDIQGAAKSLIEGIRRDLRTTDVRVAEACADIEFKDKDSTPVDSMMDKIMESRRSDSPLKKYSDGGDVGTYGMSLLGYTAPWIVLFFFSLIGFPIYCCCNYGCCCCCGYSTKEFTTCEKLWPVIVFLVGGAGILALSISGLVYALEISGNYKRMKCSMFLFVDETLNGVDPKYSTGTWAGVDGLIATGQTAINSVQAKSADFAALATLPAPAVNYVAAETELTTMGGFYDASNTGSYTTTNPVTGAGSYIVEIRTNWAAYSTSSYSYYLLLQKDIFKNAVYNTFISSRSAAAEAQNPTILNDARTQLDSVKSFSTQISDFKGTIYDGGDSGTDYIEIVQLTFSIYFGICLGCIVAMLLGTSLFIFLGWNKCKCFTHFGWCILSGCMILGFLLGAILFPLSVVLIEACDLMELGSLSKDRGVIPSDVWDQISICLTGTGDLYTKYNLNTKLSFADDLFAGFDVASTFYNVGTGSYVYNISDAWVTTTTNIKNVELDKASPTLFAANNVLGDLSSGNCKGDKVVWASSSCGTTPQVVDPASASGSCLVITTWVSNAAGISARYASCSAYQTKLVNVINYATGLQAFLTHAISRVNVEFKNALDTGGSASGITNFMTTSLALKASVNSEITQLSSDLKTGMNCLFVKTAYVRLYNAFCGYVAPNLASLALLIIMISCFDIIAIIFVTCVNRRWNQNEKVGPTKDEKET